jgi:hypothetical protein
MNNDEKTIGFSGDKWIVVNLNNGYWKGIVTYKNKTMSFYHDDIDELYKVIDFITGVIRLVEGKSDE